MANTQLRELRERTVSNQYRGECLSRQELAELVNSYLWKVHGELVELDAGYIGKLERGVISWPGKRYREALRAILAVTADAQLGFRRIRRITSPVRSSGCAGSSDGSTPRSTEAESLILPGASHASHATIPEIVGPSHIQDVAVAAEWLSDWDHLRGGWSLLDATLAQTRWAWHLLKAPCPVSLRPSLSRAVADLVGVCGFKLFDIGALREAQQHFQCAVTCVEEAGDWNRRARLLARLVRVTLESGDLDKALTLAEFALVRADRLAPNSQAMLHVVHAKSLAANRREQEAKRALGHAEDLYCREGGDEPGLLRTDRYTDGHFAGDTAEVLAILKLTGVKNVDVRASFNRARNEVISPTFS